MEEYKYKRYIIIKVEEHKWYVKLNTKENTYVPFPNKYTCKAFIKTLKEKGEEIASKYCISTEEQMKKGV